MMLLPLGLLLVPVPQRSEPLEFPQYGGCRWLLGKLNRHLPSLIISRVEVIEEKTKSPQHRYVVQVTLESNGTLLRGEGRGKELFTAIDKVTEIMQGQIEHHKGKLYEKGRGSSLARSKFGEGVEATEPSGKVKGRGSSLARSKFGEGVEATEPSGKVVKVKRFAIKPMPVSEAIGQMDLLGHDFFLFLNVDSGKISLLYRRKDGNFGQIEPELD